MPHIKKSVHSHLIETLSEKNPNATYRHAQGGGVHIWEEDADVQQHEDYYAKKRKTKPNAMDNAKALMKQEERLAEGTFAENHVTPDVHEELVRRLLTPGSLQRHMPRQIKH